MNALRSKPSKNAERDSNGDFPGDSHGNFDATVTIHEQLFIRDDLREFDREYESLPPGGSSC